ncbi:helix-turn-helix domain-containing protein [Streptomyces sp. NPDC050803]|uniref:helix-turn-helix domain-containing protein n=1 Tax=unclassified Streptomyces TaxID=2593676 RepID=UPI003432D2FF
MTSPPTPADRRTFGFLRVSTFGGAAQDVVHDPDGDAVLLGLHTVGRATLVRRGTGAACPPNAVFLHDAAEPFVLRETEEFTLHLVRIPRRALTLTDQQVAALCGRAPCADGPVAPLLASVLREIAAAPPATSPYTARHLAGGVADLVALLAAGDADPGPRAGQDREALVRRVRAHVDAHLWDRGLTPAGIAEALHISIRYLHRLFEGQGSTVGRWIQHRRLEEARRELARPGRGDITVSAVARRWGFASATHFSRSFRAAYGMSPSDWRDSREPARTTAAAGQSAAGATLPERRHCSGEHP